MPFAQRLRVPERPERQAVDSYRDALKENIAALRSINIRSKSDGKEGGIAEFDAEYICSFDELLRAMLDIQSKLNIEFDSTKATPENITIRLRDVQ